MGTHDHRDIQGYGVQVKTIVTGGKLLVLISMNGKSICSDMVAAN